MCCADRSGAAQPVQRLTWARCTSSLSALASMCLDFCFCPSHVNLRRLAALNQAASRFHRKAVILKHAVPPMHPGLHSVPDSTVFQHAMSEPCRPSDQRLVQSLQAQLSCCAAIWRLLLLLQLLAAVCSLQPGKCTPPPGKVASPCCLHQGRSALPDINHQHTVHCILAAAHGAGGLSLLPARHRSATMSWHLRGCTISSPCMGTPLKGTQAAAMEHVAARQQDLLRLQAKALPTDGALVLHTMRVATEAEPCLHMQVGDGGLVAGSKLYQAAPGSLWAAGASWVPAGMCLRPAGAKAFERTPYSTQLWF